MRFRTPIGLATLLASLAPSLRGGGEGCGGVQVGDRPDYRFRQELINGLGVSSLEDFGGKPVLVDFWGTT